MSKPNLQEPKDEACFEGFTLVLWLFPRNPWKPIETWSQAHRCITNGQFYFIAPSRHLKAERRRVARYANGARHGKCQLWNLLTSPRSHQHCPSLAQQRGMKWNRETWNNCGIPWFTPPCKVMRKTHHCGLCIDTHRRTRWFIRTKPTAVQTGIWSVAQKASKHLLLLKNRSRRKGESVNGELLYFIVCDSLVHRDNLQCEGHQEGIGHKGFQKPKYERWRFEND